MKVFIAGATGYLGKFLVQEYLSRGWDVIALVRNESADLGKARKVVAQATDASTLDGLMEGVDLVVSALGITKPKKDSQNGYLTYRDVDYQANKNILDEALRANVPRFAYIHVLGAEQMKDVEMVARKQDFVNLLRYSDIESTVICPSGFFSDMKEFLDMAKGGRVWLFGDGKHRINPIHGRDLARATADAVENGKGQLDVGGPDIFTHQQISKLAFECLGEKPKIAFIPDFIRRLLLNVLPWVTPGSIWGPGQFFLTVSAMDLVGDCHGELRLRDFYMDTIQSEKAKIEK